NRASCSAGSACAQKSQPRRATPTAVIVDLPVLLLSVRQQPAVRVDRAWVTDQGQHGQVVVRVGVREAVSKIKFMLPCQCSDGFSLGRPMQQLALETPVIDPVDVLGSRTQGTGQSHSRRDDPGNLYRRGRHQPDLLAHIEMQLRERPGARPDTARDRLLVNLIREPY